MKFIKAIRVSVVFVLFFCFESNLSSKERLKSSKNDKKITLAIGEWPPYTSSSLKNYGLFSEIVKRAFALVGVEVEYVFYPWKRALSLAEFNKHDGSITWFKTSERVKKFYYSDQILNSEFVFFHLSSQEFDWKNIDDLRKRKIGATIGFNYGNEFQRAEKLKIIKVERASKDELNFRKLLKRRIDIFATDLIVGKAMLRKLYTLEIVNKFTHHKKPIRTDPMYLLLTKKNKENGKLIKVFNEGLKKLKKSGEFDQCVNYGCD